MAAAKTRTEKKRILYEILLDLSSVDIFYDEKKTKRRARTKTLGYFDAERIISSRQNSQATRFQHSTKDHIAALLLV